MRKYISLILLVNLILCSNQTSEFNVKGMMCGFGCAKKIEKEINLLEGIKDFSVNFDESNMIVTYNSDLINDEIIMNVLNTNTTYSCTLKEEKKNNSFISFFKNLF